MTEETTGTPPASGDWREGLSDELRQDPALQDFKDVAGLAKAYKDTKAMVGGMLRIPGEDAGEEDRAAFRQRLLEKNIGLMPTPDKTDEAAMRDVYRALGMPEEASGYEQIEGMEPERFGQIAQIAHQAGVPADQFKTVLGQLVEADRQVAEQSLAKHTAELGQLKGEWGEAYDAKLARAVRIAEATKAPEGLVEAIKGGMADAATLRWLDSLGGSLGQEGNQLATQIGAITEDTKAELEAKRDELSRRLIRENLPPSEHARLVAKLVEYNERLVAA